MEIWNKKYVSLNDSISTFGRDQQSVIRMQINQSINQKAIILFKWYQNKIFFSRQNHTLLSAQYLDVLSSEIERNLYKICI
jgi:hypothetical protein